MYWSASGVEDALGKQALAFLRQLEAACLAADELAEAVEASFLQHPDAEVILSFPGLGVQLGARVLAEIGDDRQRFADARGLKAYAGSAPITRVSGKKHHVGRRMVKNDRLNHAGYLWAFSALRSSPGADAHYRRRREQGDRHAAAHRRTRRVPLRTGRSRSTRWHREMSGLDRAEGPRSAHCRPVDVADHRRPHPTPPCPAPRRGSSPPPWERSTQPRRLTPARVRRGFRHLRVKTAHPADVPRPFKLKRMETLTEHVRLKQQQG
ncbi:mini-circle putative transposase for [Streptomyces himastatinicus ATCC 53653]|uniref:Mini-circle putative transposase for n=1 Tax=Streptomyces himastatinicus ATCC 53653 TaxID=457427 RepID=D9WIY5_9ACTN|nr:mini-circle putative transposase for [Streptomyces himastatinicus ATCC 53653]